MNPTAAAEDPHGIDIDLDVTVELEVAATHVAVWAVIWDLVL